MRCASLVRWTTRGVAIACLAVLVGLPPKPVQAADNQGKYGNMTAQWWKWVYSLPVSDNPLYDETGEKAYNGQPNKKVFFLVGVINESGTATRHITIPKGTPLFGPVINVEWDNIGVDDPYTVKE